MPGKREIHEIVPSGDGKPFVPDIDMTQFPAGTIATFLEDAPGGKKLYLITAPEDFSAPIESVKTVNKNTLSPDTITIADSCGVKADGSDAHDNAK